MTEKFKKVVFATLKNKIFKYLFSRYFTYFLQFVNNLWIAKILGAYDMGIWGFVLLIIQYCMHINFGVAHAFNTLASIHRKRERYVQLLFQSSFTLLLIIGSIVGGLFILNTHYFDFGSKYSFLEYSSVVGVIAFMNYFITLYTNLFRVYNKLFEIAFMQSLNPVLLFLTVAFSPRELLIENLVYAYLISYGVSVLLAVYRSPIPFKIVLPRKLLRTIIGHSIFLFLYNTSFYLIMMTTRSFVSDYYNSDEFGVYSLAFTLVRALLMFLQAFMYLIVPKTINRLATATYDEVKRLLEYIRDTYVLGAHLLIHLLMLGSPLLLYLFPDYGSMLPLSVRIIGLAMVLSTNVYGYSSLLMAKGYIKHLGAIAFTSLLLNIVICYVLASVVNVGYIYVTFATVMAHLVFLYVASWYTEYLLTNKRKSLWEVLSETFPKDSLFPFLLSASQIVLFSYYSSILLMIAVDVILILAFIALNKNRLVAQAKTFLKVVEKPGIIDI